MRPIPRMAPLYAQAGENYLPVVVADAASPIFDDSDLTSLFVGRDGSGGNTIPGDPTSGVVGLQLDKSHMGGMTAAAYIDSRPELSVVTFQDASTAPSTATLVDGVLTANADGQPSRPRFEYTTSANDWVLIEYTRLTGTETISVNAGTTSGATNLGAATFGASGTLLIQATSSSTWVNFIRGGTTVITGTVSVKVIPGQHRTVAADNERPVLDRRPVSGRRNLLTSTEDFTSVWDTTRVTVTPDYDGTGTLIGKDTPTGTFRYLGQDFTALASTGEHTARFRVKPVVGTQCTLLMSGNAASTTHVRAVFDTNALTATNIGSTNFVDAGIIDNGDGTFDVWITGDLPVISNCDVYFYPNFYSSTDDGQFVVYKTQVNAGGLTNFQTVTNDNDITEPGVRSVYSLATDGVDDGLSSDFEGGAGPADCSVFFAVKTTDTNFVPVASTDGDFVAFSTEGTSAKSGIGLDCRIIIDGVDYGASPTRTQIREPVVTKGDYVLVEYKSADLSLWAGLEFGQYPLAPVFNLSGNLIGPIIVPTSKLTNSLRRSIKTYLKRKAGIL